MGKTKGSYVAEFPEGSIVQAANKADLELFQRKWKFHHPISDKQLEYADAETKVTSVAFYHGGDELYELEGLPGLWHEACIRGVTRS